MSYNPPPNITDPSQLTTQQWLDAFALHLETNYPRELEQLKKFLAVAPPGWSGRIKTQRHPLFSAVEWPTPELLSAMVQADVSPPPIRDGYETVLNRCISFRRRDDGTLLPYALLLEEIDIDLDGVGFNGETALYKAALKKDDTLVLYLIEKGASIDVFQTLGKSDLFSLLIKRDNISMLEKLLPLFLEKVSPVQLIDTAVQKNATKCLDRMLEMGWKISEETLVWFEENKSQVSNEIVSAVEQAILKKQTMPLDTSRRRYRI